jgi:hypothetical protein
MAALLNMIARRRHAVPEAMPRQELARARLTANWRIGANGRPECVWRADTVDPAI